MPYFYGTNTNISSIKRILAEKNAKNLLKAKKIEIYNTVIF